MQEASKTIPYTLLMIRLSSINFLYLISPIILGQVPFLRSSLNHDDIFVLDTQFKIFQFNGSNSSIQERAKALEVVQYIKDTYHDGKCEIAAVGNYATTFIFFLFLFDY